MMDQHFAETYAGLIAEGWQLADQKGFVEYVGPILQQTVDGQLACGFIAQEKHINRAGVVQGGMLATLADLTMGRVARMADPNRPQATVELNIQYIDSARIGEFVVGRGKLLRETRTLAFLSGTLESNGRLVASVSGLWKIMRPSRAAKA